MRQTMVAKFFRLAAASIVPGGGFLLAAWSPATALMLYWIDTLIGACAMGVRIALHRRWTQASGHDRGQLGATMAVSTSDEEPSPVVFKSFLAEFLLTSISFTLAHGVFLAVVLGFMAQRPDADQVRQGAIAILIFHALALSFDAWHLDRWPFARLKYQAVQIMGRVVLIHMAILAGMMLAMTRDRPGSFFTAFVWLKFFSDIGSLLPQWNPHEPPRWMVRVMKRFPKQRGETFEESWRRTRAQEASQSADDELVKPLSARDANLKPGKKGRAKKRRR
jgi:hypothetical protein